MDLGCLDLGCISVLKHSTETAVDSHTEECDTRENVTSASKAGKNKSPKGVGQSTLNALTKFTSQIKKPPHRKSSPINWFPRKKVDSYLKRKIKMLQEIDGMNLTLDETLGDSNPHYSRVLREKIAAREAAHTAMEARKGALVEASWCRILRAARIQSKEAEALLLKAEKNAAEAFEVAAAMGVIMYDMPNCPRKPSQIETSTANGGRSTTHTVTASFETAFEVDKEVAAAVKIAFKRLATCPSFNEDEVKELLCKISQNPDMDDNNQELLELSSEHESESGSELETVSQNDGFSASDADCKLPAIETRQRKCQKRRQSLDQLNMTKLVDIMLERLRCLKEDELSSLATIVATCGLNAALAEVESSKLHDDSAADYTSNFNIPRRMSSVGPGTMRYSNLEQMKRKQAESELPSLDKFLVKHMSKLEREVQEAKNSKRNGSVEGDLKNTDKADNGRVNSENKHDPLPDLGSILVKHTCKLEKEIEEAKKNSRQTFEIAHKKPVNDSMEVIPDLGSILIKHTAKLEKEVQQIRKNSEIVDGKELERAPGKVVGRGKEEIPEVPSLDKFLIKHVSRLEKEVQEAKNKRKNDLVEEDKLMNLNKKANSSTSISVSEKDTCSSDGEAADKENVDLNKGKDRKSKMDEKQMTLPLPNTAKGPDESIITLSETEDSLDKILVKPVHRLEREKMQALSLRNNHGNIRHQNKQGGNSVTDYEGLDKVLVKHVSRLEREKMEFSLNREDQKMKTKGRNVHMQMNEEGGLDQILVKHKSKLEREKEKMELSLKREDEKMKTKGRNAHMQMNEEGGLDQILVKHKSRLEREKMAFSQQPEDQIRFSVSRREARERELQEVWEGLSLGNSIRPHLSKLERDKAAWIKAEEEERRQAIEKV